MQWPTVNKTGVTLIISAENANFPPTTFSEKQSFVAVLSQASASKSLHAHKPTHGTTVNGGSNPDHVGIS